MFFTGRCIFPLLLGVNTSLFVVAERGLFNRVGGGGGRGLNGIEGYIIRRQASVCLMMMALLFTRTEFVYNLATARVQAYVGNTLGNVGRDGIS